MKNYILYPEFDLSIYKTENNLTYLTDEEAINHYETIGKYGGLICSHIKQKKDFVNLVNINNITNGLEIGPLCRPHLKNIPSINYAKYVDYFSNEELLNINGNTEWIMKEGLQNIDYVVKDGIYSNIILEKFDLVYSSHNIEHVPCLVTHLNNLSSILNENGLVFLGIPDYHFVFDRQKNPTTIFDILIAYYKNTNIPQSSQILEMMYFGCANDPYLHWNNELNNNKNSFLFLKEKEDFLKSRVDDIVNNIDNIKHIILNNRDYHDSHCWKFSPWNFKFIMKILYDCKLTDIKLVRCYNTLVNHNEFFAVLQKISH
jgi:hypothetical protein